MQRNSSKIHKYTDNRHCDSKLGKDYSTKLKTCTFPVEFLG